MTNSPLFYGYVRFIVTSCLINDEKTLSVHYTKMQQISRLARFSADKSSDVNERVNKRHSWYLTVCRNQQLSLATLPH